MSNMNADRLDHAMQLRGWRESLGHYKASRALPDLTAADIAFLDGSIAGLERIIERNKQFRIGG